MLCLNMNTMNVSTDCKRMTTVIEYEHTEHCYAVMARNIVMLSWRATKGSVAIS